MEVFGLGLKIKEEGAATVEASIKRLGAELAKTALTVGGVTKALQLFVRETADAQREQAQLASALRSTNGVSGQTLETLNTHAKSLQNLTAFTGGAISEAQALLLTFTNIRETFPEATQATLDLAQALQMDTRSAAMMLGKALNDPVLGVTTLRRAGVQLSESQTELVKKLVASNQTLEAQRIILNELNTQVGGSAEAYRNTLGGAIAALTETFHELFEANEETGASLTGTINALNEMVQTLKGPVQFVFTNFTKGLVTIASLVGQVALAILRFFTAIGAAALTFAGAFGVLLPGIGDNIGKMVDDMNEKVSSNDAYFAGLQDRLRDWRTEVVMGTTATKEFANTLKTIPTEGAGGGRGGPPTAAELGGRQATTFFTPTPRGAFLQDIQTNIRGLIPQAKSIVLTDAQKLAVELHDTFQESIGTALVGGIVGGIQQAVASGSISDGFKAFGSTMLAGLGDAMVRFGVASEAFAGLMKTILTSLSSLLPGGALVASIAMIGIGAALGGVARGMFGGQRGGSAASIRSFGGGGTGFASGIPVTQLVFGSTSATTAAGMQPRTPMNVTVIGPNDPSAQRAIQELMNKANSRGRIG